MRSTGNVFDAPTSNNPEEPSCNTGQSMTCLFNRTHTNIKSDNFRKHLMTQSMLAPEEKVKSARGTERVKGKSYRQGPVYISNHEDIGRMEV
jgi:hypothetical protein